MAHIKYLISDNLLSITSAGFNRRCRFSSAFLMYLFDISVRWEQH